MPISTASLHYAAHASPPDFEASVAAAVDLRIEAAITARFEALEYTAAVLLCVSDLDQRGQLWLGHWHPPLRRELSPLLQRLSRCEGQATLARIGRRATEALCISASRLPVNGG